MRFFATFYYFPDCDLTTRHYTALIAQGLHTVIILTHDLHHVSIILRFKYSGRGEYNARALDCNLNLLKLTGDLPRHNF